MIDTDRAFSKLLQPYDDIFQEELLSLGNRSVEKSENIYDYEFWGDRDKRNALALAGFIKCTTQFNPLSFKGYGCFCGFLGAGEPVDAIDT